MSSWQEKRAKYEFDKGTKRYAKELAGWKCEQCGCSPTKDNWLEADHLLPILAVVKKFQFMNPVIIKHLANLQVLCKSCHDERHQTITEDDWSFLANELINRYADWMKNLVGYEEVVVFGGDD